jgi:hypothetical protein
MEYGVIYIKICPKKGHKSEWIKYCHIFSAAPKSLQQNIIQISNDINTKYSNDIVIPMDTTIHPGCTTTPDMVEEIATDMFNMYSEMMSRQGVDNCIRCVYSIGELSDVNVTSTHNLFHKDGGYDDVMIKIGRFLDESDETGIFRI